MAQVMTSSVVRQIETLFAGGSVTGLSDRQLIERFIGRRDPAGEAAFAALVARHGPMVLGVCRQLLGDRHHAEDAFQATFLVLARKARSIRDPDLLGNWLYGAALRTARKARGRLARHRQREEGGAWDRSEIDPSAPADEPIVAREQAEALHNEIGRLPVSFRLPVVLCYFEGLTVEEAARQLQWPHGSVRSRLARARDKLRIGLTRRGVVLPAAVLAAGLSPRSASASVSSSLCDITTKAAIQFAAGQAASPLAASLAQEVLRAMFVNKLRLIATTLLLLAAVATGAGYLTRSLASQDEAKRQPDAPRPLGAQPLPNDPMLAEQWYLYPPGDKRGSPGGINAIEAWRHVRPAKPIVVALLDTGVNYTHPDLVANIWKNEREMPNGKDDDGNGYVDDLFGWDFAYANNNPIGRRSLKFPDQFDHGTAVASLIAAVPDNRIGTVGVGRNVRVMNLRVGGDPDFDGEKSIQLETTLPQAIRYAIRNGARVIVCTLGSLDPPERHFGTSLKEAENAGVLFIKSAGNQGRNIDDDQLFKFISQYSNVIVVGGTNRDGTLSRHMNFGKRVGIAAPSVDMVFPSFDGYVRFKGPGTSFSAPIVAGVAATLLSQAPDLTPPQVITRLRDASVFAPGMEGVIGGGRLDMARLFPP